MLQCPKITIALVTPFDDAGALDEAGFKRQCEWVKAQGVTSVIPGGTTGEFAGMTAAERLLILKWTRVVMPNAFIFANVSACALEDALELTRQAISSGASPDALLILPPFYHKPFSAEQGEAGVEAYFKAYFERVSSADFSLAHVPGVFLYTFAVHTQAPVTPAVYGRLAKAYPKLLRGIKASAVGLADAEAFRSAAPGTVVTVGNGKIQLDCLKQGLHVVSGDCLPICYCLRYLEELAAAAGCGEQAARLQAALIDVWRGVMDHLDEIPANKCSFALNDAVATRELVRPPLVSLNAHGESGISLQKAIQTMRSVIDSMKHELPAGFQLVPEH